MAADIVNAEQRAAFLRLEVCPNVAGGVCQCPDPSTHEVLEYAGAPPAGAGRRAWQSTCKTEAIRLVESKPPSAEVVAALIGARRR